MPIYKVKKVKVAKFIKCPCHLLDEILFLVTKKNLADEKWRKIILSSKNVFFTSEIVLFAGNFFFFVGKKNFRRADGMGKSHQSPSKVIKFIKTCQIHKTPDTDAKICLNLT